MSGQVFLSCADVAELLGVTVQTIYNWRSAGRFDCPAYKIGRLVKYRQADIERWLEEQSAA